MIKRPTWPTSLLLLVLLAHLAMSVRLFPTWGSLVDPEAPVIMVDHAIHLYHGALGSRFLLEHGATWGYDPAFMAGYPETPVWDSSSNLSILFQAIAGGGYHPVAYKVGLLSCLVLVLVAFPVGTLAMGLGRWEALVATCLAALYVWVGFPRGLWLSGLFAFVTAAAMLVPSIGLALRFDEHPTARLWMALAASGAAVLFAHVTAPILALGAGAGFLPAAVRRHDWRWASALVAAAVVAVTANLFWLVPLWKFRGIRDPSFGFMTTNSASFLLDFYREPSPDGRISLILLVLGIAGLASWCAEGRSVRASTFGAAIGSLLALFGFGSLWSVTRTVEPLRFMVPLDFLLTVPAASAACRITAAFSRRGGDGVRGAAFASMAWVAASGGVFAADPATFFAAGRILKQPRPLAVGLRHEMRTLVRWLSANTDPSARVLFEDQLRLLEATTPESVHWTPLLPVLLEPESRQFIGGLYQTAFINHHRMAAFGDFRLGDRSIDAWTSDGLAGYFRQYNVGWAVCWSPLSRFCFDRLPNATRVAVLPRYCSPTFRVSTTAPEWQAIAARAGPEVARRYMTAGARNYAIYRIERPHSYFLRGRGRLASVAPNRVELVDVSPEDGEVVLSLHWLDTWQGIPPLAVGPVRVGGDPVPFVRIELPGPRGRVVLFNGYGSSPRSRSDSH